MWNKSLLDNGQHINYRVYENMFEVECVINCESDKTLFLHAVTPGNEDSRLCVGSFVKADGKLYIRKKYSVEYMKLNNIYPQTSIGFFIEDADGKCVTSTDLLNDCKQENEKTDDFAVARAREILDSFKCSGADSGEAVRIARNTHLILNGFPDADIGCFRNFKWHRIESINENFSLSGVVHLICESDFVMNFVKQNEWYFGCCDERLFAVCIKTDSELSPFANAADCSSFEKVSENVYHAVGIALLDDGQYFYDLKGIAN